MSAGSIYLGYSGVAGLGTYAMTGPTATLTAGSLCVPGTRGLGRRRPACWCGRGTYNQSAGVADWPGLTVGRLAGSTGAIHLTGGTLKKVSGSEFVGVFGKGTFTQSGGSNVIGTRRCSGLWLGGGGRRRNLYHRQRGCRFDSQRDVYVGGTTAGAGGTGVLSLNGRAPIAGGTSAQYSYDALPAGTYQFFCSVHPGVPGMTGTLTVK